MKKILIINVLIYFSINCFSQDIIGGNFYIQQTGVSTIMVTLNIFTIASGSQDAYISWGDNTSSLLVRTNHNTSFNYDVNKFVNYHIYPGSGTYEITVYDSSRVNLINIANSQTKPLIFKSLINLYNSNYIGNTPSFIQNSSFERAPVDSVYNYYPDAYDTDGDSLIFELIPCIDSTYFYPPATNYFGINSETGVITWDKPTTIGMFAVAYRIREIRNNIEVGQVIHEMTIVIEPHSNLIKKIDNDLFYQIYPNPVNSILKIESKNIIKQIEIFNLQGIKKMIINNPNTQEIKIKIDDFQKGIYFIKIYDEYENIKISKLLKE